MQPSDSDHYECAQDPLRVHGLDRGARRVVYYEGRALPRAQTDPMLRSKRAIVYCPGFIQNRYSFSTPGRCMLSFFRRHGFDVYVVELHGHHRDERYQSGSEPFEAYVRCDIPAVLDDVCKHYSRVGFIGHSMGGWIGTALEHEDLKRLHAVVTIGTPSYPGVHAFPFRALIERAVTQLSTKASKYRNFFDGEFFARRFKQGRWLFDSRFAPHFSQIWYPGSIAPNDLDYFLKHSFSPESVHVLASLMELNHTRGIRAGAIPYAKRLAQFNKPLLVIGGDKDGLAPPALVEELYDRAQTSQKNLCIAGAADEGIHFGHMDLLVGRQAPQYVWGPVLNFFNAHLD